MAGDGGLVGTFIRQQKKTMVEIAVAKIMKLIKHAILWGKNGCVQLANENMC